jgi:DNA-binding CsgD family transcriptional regulator
MPEKKRTRSTPISDSEILAMYEAVIPLLSNNPEGLDISDQINRWLLRFVPYDFCHFVMHDPQPDRSGIHLNLVFERWGRFEPDKNDDASSMSIHPATAGTGHATFEEEIERNYQTAIARSKVKRPDISKYHYYRIESKTHPNIAIGFFRYNDLRSKNPFSSKEKDIFDQLTPHLISLFRAVLGHRAQSQTYQYFKAFAQLGSKLATDYSLSESEVRLIPDILFGYSSEEIAERQFISLATVKTHINHMLKKTGTKSRLDLIGKFFTSPDHVQL